MEVSKLYRDLQRSQHCSSSCTSYVCMLLLLLTTIISDTYGQSVTVTMENAKSDVATNTATMVCKFGIDDPSYTFSNLLWSKGTTTLAHFLGGSADPNYLNYCQTLSPSPCTITRDSSRSDLVLSPVVMARDDGSDYECQVTYTLVADNKLNQAVASLVVIVPTSNMTMINGSSLDSFNDGDEVDLSLDVTSHIFQCEVPGINPQATFTWTVGGNQLSSDITENHVVDSGTGLTTSTSKATLKPDPSYNGKDLICEAKNYEGDPGVTFRLSLKVADPCKVVTCMNGGTCTIDPNDPSMPMCECPGGYKGELCGTAITTTEEPTTTPKPQGTTDNTTTTTPQDTTAPTFTTSQETTMSPSGPTETTSDFSSTEPSTTTNTVPGSMNKTTTQMGSTEMTTDPTEMTTDPTEMTNSTHITPPTTATTPETTTGCTLLCDAGSHERLSDGVIIGIVAGCLGGVAIIAVGSVAAWNYHKKTDVSPQTDQSKNGKDGKDKTANGKADDKPAGTADV